MSYKTDYLKSYLFQWGINIIQLCLLLVLILSLIVLYNMVKQDMETQAKEGECIKQLISLGIERANIGVANGTCYIKETVR